MRLRSLKSYVQKGKKEEEDDKRKKKKKNNNNNKIKETSLTVNNHYGADVVSILYHIAIRIVLFIFIFLICWHGILQHRLLAAYIFGDGSQQEDQENLGMTSSCDKILKRNMTYRAHPEILPRDKVLYTTL